MQPRAEVHRTIVAVDVAEFSRPAKTLYYRRAVRDGLYEVLTKALADTGIDLDRCIVEDRGDGAMILVPPDIPKSPLAETLPDRLAVSVRWYNAHHSPEEALRLRVALHAGEVQVNERGAMGHAINLAFRMLAAPAAKEALQVSTSSLAVIASEWFFDEVVRHSPAGDAHLYRQIPVQVKEISTRAWLRLPHSEPMTALPPPNMTASSSGLPVRIYVSNGAVHHRVESAVLELLESADLEVEHRDDPVRGGLLND